MSPRLRIAAVRAVGWLLMLGGAVVAAGAFYALYYVRGSNPSALANFAMTAMVAALCGRAVNQYATTLAERHAAAERERPGFEVVSPTDPTRQP